MNDTSQPRVRMDKSRDHSTVHGDRNRQDDPHRLVHFYQGGLPFDAQGYLLVDHPEITEDTPEGAKRRAAVEKLLKRAGKSRPIPQSADEGVAQTTVEEIDDDDDEGDVQVNLEDWITGREQYPWTDVSNAIVARYGKRVTSQPEAIVFLVEEKLVGANEVAKRFQKHLQ